MTNFNGGKLKLLVILLCLISVFKVQALNSDCCNEDGVISESERLCRYNKSFAAPLLLHCKIGKYLIRPDRDPDDAFTIDEDGFLEFTEAGILVEPESFCVGSINNSNTTERVAFLCFEENEGSTWTYFVKGILGFISVIFICATLYVYYLIPTLRETQDKVTIICISCLAILFVTLGTIQTVITDTNKEICIILAFLVYFSIVAYFAWLNAVTANVLKVTMLHRWRIKESHWYILNHIYGWTVPIVLTSILLAGHHSNSSLNPGFGQGSCWFRESRHMWMFVYIPMSITIFFNCVFFVLSICSLHKHSANVSNDKHKALKYRLSLYFKLFILSGLTWIFELFSYAFKKYSWYWIATDIINALHGLLIFLILVVFRKKIRRELNGKRICCCKMPQKWTKVNEEHDDDMSSEETKHYRLNSQKE